MSNVCFVLWLCLYPVVVMRIGFVQNVVWAVGCFRPRSRAIALRVGASLDVAVWLGIGALLYR